MAQVRFIKSLDRPNVSRRPNVPIMGQPDNVEQPLPIDDMIQAMRNLNNADNTSEFDRIIKGTQNDFIQALGNGAVFTPAQMEALFAHHQTNEEKTPDPTAEFERCGIICNGITRTYRLANSHLDAIIPGLSQSAIAHRICCLKTVVELKKIGYTRELIYDFPEANGSCLGCTKPAIYSADGQQFCSECMEERFPLFNRDPFIVVDQLSFADPKKPDELPTCVLCQEEKKYFVLPTGCGCAKAENLSAHCINCYVDWCEKRFTGANRQEHDDEDGVEYEEEVMQASRLVPCPFCRKQIIPF